MRAPATAFRRILSPAPAGVCTAADVRDSESRKTRTQGRSTATDQQQRSRFKRLQESDMFLFLSKIVFESPRERWWRRPYRERAKYTLFVADIGDVSVISRQGCVVETTESVRTMILQHILSGSFRCGKVSAAFATGKWEPSKPPQFLNVPRNL